MPLTKKELATILSTDMSKAFDSLCHNLVIKNSRHIGSLVCQSLDLIRSYLNDRYSRGKLSSIRSGLKTSRGGPQGSSFGPLLWNLFQKDMTLVVKDTNLMYVDDCVL